jgi:hypothetical protein
MAISGIAVIFFVYASAYLDYSEKPVKSDAVVLFVGPDYESRMKKALRLIEEGYADALFIPAHYRVLVVRDGSRRVQDLPLGSSFQRAAYPRYYENTQIEVSEVKRMMDQAGYKSALFVSSAYHMRRISIIAKKIFAKGDYRVTCVAGPAGPAGRYADNPWLFFWNRLQHIVEEYIKIAWLRLQWVFIR